MQGSGVTDPLDVECIHPDCLAAKKQPCGYWDYFTSQRLDYLVDGKPGFHEERYASLAMDSGQGVVPVSREEIDRAAEDLV